MAKCRYVYDSPQTQVKHQLKGSIFAIYEKNTEYVKNVEKTRPKGLLVP